LGVRNFLIDGVSGAGKTTVAEELERRGYHVLHGDRTLAYTGDPLTGERLEPRGRADAEAIAWGYERWIWPVERVRTLIADRSHPVSFFCGGSRNSSQYIELFDAVFVLEVDIATLRQRVTGRGDDEFGGTPGEWALLEQLHATRESVPQIGVIIDATAPVDRVVDDILARCAKA
jgi:broad-specificity NMP kinase